MTRQPRQNEDRFHLYPLHRVAATLDQDAHLDTALHNLERAGVDVTDVDVLSGPDGARLLDPSGAGHGPGARLLRLVQASTYEMDALQDHERTLNEGHHVMYVPARDDNDRRKIVNALRAAGGYHLLYFRRWSIEQILT